MITQAEAADYVKATDGLPQSKWRLAEYARTLVALYAERDRARSVAIEQCNTAACALTERDRLSAEVHQLRQDMKAAVLRERRLRAAEAPGSDDAAFADTGWRSATEGRPYWHHPSGWVVRRDAHGLPCATRNDTPTVYGPARTLADLMEQVVPGSLTLVPSVSDSRSIRLGVHDARS